MKKITFLFLLTGFWAFGQDFVDVTGNLPQLSNSFAAWGDYDGDGDLDLYISGALNANSNGGGLYQNDNGSFSLVTSSGLPLYNLGDAEWGDLDNDGDLDIIIMGFDGTNGDTKIYKNNGNGTFTSVNAGLSGVYMGDVDLNDVNGDGMLDIAITGFGTPNYVNLAKVFINNGGNNFTELTGLNLPPINYGKIKFVDFDSDGDLDITLNGWNNAINNVYTKVWQNDGSQNFTELSLNLPQLWLGDFEWGDVDADGDLDFVIIGTAGSDSEAHLLINNNNTFSEDPHFGNVTGAHRVSALELADFNNDGSLDIFISGMNVVGSSENIIGKLYENNGSGIFTENTNENFEGAQYGDADAGDYDNDGKIDLLVTGADASNTFGVTKLYHNEHTGAVNDILQNKFNIYPNPAHNIININNFDNFDYTVNLTDLTGKSIVRKTTDGSTFINVTSLKPGMYLLRISDNRNSFIKKIIIK